MRPTKVPGGDRVLFSVQSKEALESRRCERECQVSQLCNLGNCLSLRLYASVSPLSKLTFCYLSDKCYDILMR